MNGNSGPQQQHEVHSLPRSESHASFSSRRSNELHHGHHHGPAGRRWAVEPLLSNPAPLLINDKPLEAYAPLGQPDRTGRAWVIVLFVLAFMQGLAWGCTVALTGRLSLRLEPGREWQQRGTGMSIQTPLNSFVWGVSLLVLSLVGGFLVDFRSAKSVSVQLAATSAWWLGGILLLLPAILEPGTAPASTEMSAPAAVLSWTGVALCAAGSAVTRPLLTVLVADQVYEQVQRAQFIGLCFICFTVGDIVAAILDAAGASAVVLCVLLICVVTLGVGALFTIRKMVDLEADPINTTARLWSEFMPSGDGGGSEWSDETLLSDSGEAPGQARACWCWCTTILRRLKRHPLMCGFNGQVERRHVRTLVKVLILGALVRATNICVRWGDEATRMDHHLCLGGGSAAPAYPDDGASVHDASPSAALAVKGTQAYIDRGSAGLNALNRGSSPGRGLLAVHWGGDAAAHDHLDADDSIDGAESPSLSSYTDALEALERVQAYAGKHGDRVRPGMQITSRHSLVWAVALLRAPSPVLLRAGGSASESPGGSGVEPAGDRRGRRTSVQNGPRLRNAQGDDNVDDAADTPSSEPSAESCLGIGYQSVVLGGAILGLLVVLSLLFSSPDGAFWSRVPQDRLSWGYFILLLAMGVASVLDIIIVEPAAVSILCQLPQYGLAMTADYMITASSLEYLYEGKTHWPRAGTTAAFYAFQGIGVLAGTLLSIAISDDPKSVLAVDEILTPGLAAAIVAVDFFV